MADVVAGLLMRNGKVLLGLRKPSGKRGSLWEMPGGKCEETHLPGDPSMRWRARECHEAALVREWREELGIEITMGERITMALFDLETCFTVTLYQVFTTDEPRCLDHAELRWVDLAEAVERLPCSPALYTHWPAVRQWLERTYPRPTTATDAIDAIDTYRAWFKSTAGDLGKRLGIEPDKLEAFIAHMIANPEVRAYVAPYSEGHTYVDPRFNAKFSMHGACRTIHGPGDPCPVQPTADALAHAQSVSRAEYQQTTTPYRCNVPMCGESGVCEECRRRGAR